ncbi:MAG: alpha/beta hydrolase-fold protein [Saprospiraceae bacterium]|nr:alpha/beta hydrolase-fold protein [Saprospiraceae bacterium]
MKAILLPFLLLISCAVSAQTNVRAWYADGQVWVVWEASLPLPDWYEVYAKPTAFSSTNDAIRVGKIHLFEYACVALKEQVDTALTPRIPNPTGLGKYQLAVNEALFVFTPHQAGALVFAVVADGETVVNAGQNITATAIPFQYNPVGDPVESHLQATFPSPFAPGFVCFAFLMWADGRQNQWDNRPDFPVMANAAKNGMPSLFLVSAPIGLDTTQPFPLSVWLHGGGGTARQSLAGSRAEVNIKPVEGLLISHNDDVFGWRGILPPGLENPTWHFGYRKNYDPFNPGNIPGTPDTIVNYTQRRYLWVDQWLIRHFNIDPNRIQIHGHSMGSAGALALAKCYPEHYASVTIFNTGCGGPEPGSMLAPFGDVSQNFPTNLKNRAGETVHQLNLWNLLDNCSPERDWPLIRHWHSKNDDNGTMRWDAYVVENYRKADSLGFGVQNMWSERSHGMDTGPDYNDHWISGVPPNQQTAVDNVAFAEARFRSDQSLPAFFNHRLDPNAHDPGIGLIGINNGDGDNWGSWGGYHRWGNVVENEGNWQVTAWLESNAVFPNDNCPDDQLLADLAIRRPKSFKPATGQTLNWTVKDADTGSLLQSGTANVQNDDLVVIPQVLVYRENTRRVRISIADPSVPTSEPEAVSSAIKIEPNPSMGCAVLTVFSTEEMELKVSASGLGGKQVSFKTRLFEGQNRVDLRDFETLPAGLYFITVSAGDCQNMVKWVKM